MTRQTGTIVPKQHTDAVFLGIVAAVWFIRFVHLF